MVGVLVLFLALAAPAAAVAADTSPAQPDPPRQSDFFTGEQGASARSLDPMEMHPASDVCYKIRAYVFSQGATPRFLRETTCGPKVSQTRKTNGHKPTVVVPENSAPEKK
jgi:hypothetical protein